MGYMYKSYPSGSAAVVIAVQDMTVLPCVNADQRLQTHMLPKHTGMQEALSLPAMRSAAQSAVHTLRLISEVQAWKRCPPDCSAALYDHCHPADMLPVCMRSALYEPRAIDGCCHPPDWPPACCSDGPAAHQTNIQANATTTWTKHQQKCHDTWWALDEPSGFEQVRLRLSLVDHMILWPWAPFV